MKFFRLLLPTKRCFYGIIEGIKDERKGQRYHTIVSRLERERERERISYSYCTTSSHHSLGFLYSEQLVIEEKREKREKEKRRRCTLFVFV